MRSLTCVSVVACVARKLRPCPSYSRRRDRINLGLWRSLYKGGGYSWQDSLLTFAEIELDSTTMFTPGTNVMFICSTGEPVLRQVVGYSEHGDAYHCISYEPEGKTVLPVYCFVLQCNLCA